LFRSRFSTKIPRIPPINTHKNGEKFRCLLNISISLISRAAFRRFIIYLFALISGGFFCALFNLSLCAYFRWLFSLACFISLFSRAYFQGLFISTGALISGEFSYSYGASPPRRCASHPPYQLFGPQRAVACNILRAPKTPPPRAAASVVVFAGLEELWLSARRIHCPAEPQTNDYKLDC
jgi:hypothetical protein